VATLRVLEEIQTGIRERVPSHPLPFKKSRRFLAPMKNAFTDTYEMSADKDKIKNMERKLRDVMDRFGVRTPLYRRAAAADSILQISSLMRTERNIERLLARISEFAEAPRAAKGEVIVWCDVLLTQSIRYQNKRSVLRKKE
jgi:hypothetical protein